MKALKKFFPNAILSVICAIVIGCGIGVFAVNRSAEKSAHAETSFDATEYYGAKLPDPV